MESPSHQGSIKAEKVYPHFGVNSDHFLDMQYFVHVAAYNYASQQVSASWYPTESSYGKDTTLYIQQSMYIALYCWLVRDLNVPFGGAKMSRVGREGLKDSLELYTEVKTLCIKH